MPYPGVLDALSTSYTDSIPSPVTHPGMHNSTNAAINNTQAALGTDPQGSYATVKARLDALAGNTALVSGAFVTGKYKYGISPGAGILSRTAAQLAIEFADYKLAGNAWCRFDAYWNAFEPTTQGTFNWATLDKMMLACATNGIKPLILMSQTPGWAKQAALSGYDYSPPNDLAATGSPNFNTALTALINRYKPGNTTAGIGGGSCSHWEIWNEPNLQSSWRDTGANPKPNAARYANLLKGAYTAAKAADANCTVISAGLAPFGLYGSVDANSGSTNMESFLESMYMNGGLSGKFDALGWHPYFFDYGANNMAQASTSLSATSDYNGWWEMYGTPNSARNQMITNGDGAKPIWLTETGGYRTDTPAYLINSEQQVIDQIQLDVKAHNALSAHGVAGPMFYYSYGVYDPNQGLVDSAGAKKNRFYSYAHACKTYGSSLG